jgi:hypothetical protein
LFKSEVDAAKMEKLVNFGNLVSIFYQYNQKVEEKLMFHTKSDREVLQELKFNFKTISAISDGDTFYDNNLSTNVYRPKTVRIERRLNFDDEDKMIRWLRILIEWKLESVQKINIILCSEIEYKMFTTFMKLIIKLTMYHKNESTGIESCQFRNG